jgi:hypothetical protein
MISFDCYHQSDWPGWSYYKFIISQMQDRGSIAKLRECFNESTFFSTEVSSPSHSQINQPIVRISSKFTDEPTLYLKKLRIKTKEASSKCLQALQGSVKARVELQRVEKEAALSRYDFMRLYNTKKFRLDEQALLSSHKIDHEFNFRLSLQRTKRLRALNEVSLSARKEQQIRNIEGLFESNKQERSVTLAFTQIFRETLRMRQEEERRCADESAERVRKERASMQVRMKHLSDLTSTKSKFNYLSKINEEMQAIKEYQVSMKFTQQMVDNL